MNLRTYQARTMAEALAEVKRDLGRDAVILHMRSFRKGGLLGLFGGRSMWEVTAAPNINVVPRIAKGQYVSDLAQGAGAQAAPVEARPPGAPPEKAPLAVPHESAAEGIPGASPDAVNKQMGEIRSMIEKLLSLRPAEADGDLPGELKEVRQELLQQDVDEHTASELVGQLRMNLTGRELADRQLIRERLAGVIASRIPTVSAKQADAARGARRVIAMIGPTGVGKTTTIAKLAANFKLREGKRVGLITIDTYRVAAVDQLRTYADIIDVPLQAVLTPAELQQATQAMSDVDVVLIDTAGRSQNNQLRLGQLRGFLAAASPTEVHLVIAATSNRRCALRALERFCALGVNRIILTKLDEAETFGVILTASMAGGAALSYVTTGQDVPDDIAPADSQRLARSIIEGNMRACR